MATIIGRNRELETIKKAVASDHAELIAVYGRRRVGKTYLVKEYFKNKFDFYATGVYEGKQVDELSAFCTGFDQEFLENRPRIRTWMEAFVSLRDFLKAKRKKKIIVFLDELPWFDVPPGRFLKAFEWFWNSWGSTQKNLKLIVCGSSTTWMINKFISSKGGFYNRATGHIYLAPFNLRESRALLKHLGFRWRETQVLDLYMIIGGIPYYYNLLDKSLSPEQNVDRLFFKKGAVLQKEYDFLLKSLFKEAEYYSRILEVISSKNQGVTRKVICEQGGLTDNGALTKALKTLADCDFIREYASFGKTQRDSLYQLLDPFVLFYKRFVEKYKGKDEDYWVNNIQSPKRNSWKGISYEMVCLLHLQEIKKALGINGISTWAGSWIYKGNGEIPGTQIDLLIDRVDKIINICEMKYTWGELEINKKLERSVEERERIFSMVTHTGKTITNILVTPKGLSAGKYGGLFSKVITLQDLMV